MISTYELIELEHLLRREKILEGVNSFWRFCQLKDPLKYTDDKLYIKDLCDKLQLFYERKLLREDGQPYTKLMINMPPRHLKTRTLTHFCQWVFGKNKKERIITCSYNDDSAGDFAKFTRDGVTEENFTDESEVFVFSDFFPEVKLKYGTSSYYKWALDGEHFNYLGAGIMGGITGRGGSVLMIDDPIKSAEEAFNDERLEKIWTWYTGTFLSRGESEVGLEPLELINMTRWSNNDLCGKILDSDEANKWYVVKYKAYDESTASMLCESILSHERYKELEKKMVFEIFQANYNQEAVSQTGRLYKSFKTYNQLPTIKGTPQTMNYTDTADEGSDYLCSINFIIHEGESYITDIYYTKDGMEITEPATAKFLYSDGVQVAHIESNNGGRGFARNVIRLLWETHKSRTPIVKWFHQTENKKARIMATSAFVQEHIYLPENWRDRFPEFYKAVNTFLKEGKNKHDDAEDCLAGVAEKTAGRQGFVRRWN